MAYPYLIAAIIEPCIDAIDARATVVGVVASEADEVALMTASAYAVAVEVVAESSAEACAYVAEHVAHLGHRLYAASAIAARYDCRDPRTTSGTVYPVGMATPQGTIVVLPERSASTIAAAELRLRELCGHEVE